VIEKVRPDSGAWRTARQAQALLNAPDFRTIHGLRDGAIIAVLLGYFAILLARAAVWARRGRTRRRVPLSSPYAGERAPT
jgi:hypothetical protein